MTARRGVLALWGSAAILVVASGAAMLNYASRMAESMSGQGVYTQIDWQWASAVSLLISPLFMAALITVLLALIAHATLWRRAHVTQPEQPQES